MKKYYLPILILGILIGFLIHNLWPEGEAAAKLVTIRSRNLQYKVMTRAETMGELFEEQNLRSTNEYESTNPVVHGITIEIGKPVSITINDGGNKTEVTTTAATVSDLLYEEKIALAATDRVNPPLESFLGQDLQIQIDRIVDLEITLETEIPFERKLVYTDELLYGREQLVEEGVPGKKIQKFLITYQNGVETRRRLLSEEIVSAPRNAELLFGTRIEIEEYGLGRASWYAYQGCLCAAHPHYEFGRFVRVTREDTGKSIIVRVNDRGPNQKIHPERIIDLDSVAYRELAPLGSGTIGVRVELLRN